MKMLEDYTGGNKHPQMCIAGGGFNHFPEQHFLDWFKTLNWYSPDNIVLIMQPEDGPTLYGVRASVQTAINQEMRNDRVRERNTQHTACPWSHCLCFALLDSSSK